MAPVNDNRLTFSAWSTLYTTTPIVTVNNGFLTYFVLNHAHFVCCLILLLVRNIFLCNSMVTVIYWCLFLRRNMEGGFLNLHVCCTIFYVGMRSRKKYFRCVPTR